MLLQNGIGVTISTGRGLSVGSTVVVKHDVDVLQIDYELRLPEMNRGG